MRPLLHLSPNVITDGTFIMLGSKCYYRYDSLYMFIWHHVSCHQVEREKSEQEKISQNLGMAISLSFGKFITGYETCF